MNNKLLLTILALMLAVLFTACNQTSSPESSETVAPATEVPTEEPTAAPTELPTEMPTELPTEVPTEAPISTSTEEMTEGYAADDPNDPAFNLIEVGLSGDGKTPCYDGRYLLDFTCFFNSFDLYSGSIQEVFDDLEGYGGNIAMNEFTEIGYCFSVDVPDDGNLYVLYYNWAYCDFRFNHGVTYSDETSKDNGQWSTPGYAYYSDLKVLDDMSGLDNSIIYIWDFTYGLAPGAYRMMEEPSPEMNYTYERLGGLEEYWPGLPRWIGEEE